MLKSPRNGLPGLKTVLIWLSIPVVLVGIVIQLQPLNNHVTILLDIVAKRTSETVVSYPVSHVIDIQNVHRLEGWDPNVDRIGYLNIAEPLDACEKLTPRQNFNSTAVLISSTSFRSKCSLETKLRNADRERYSIVLVQGDDSIHEQKMKSNKFHFIQTVVVISKETLEVIKKFAFPKSVRFYLKARYNWRTKTLREWLDLPLFSEEYYLFLVQLYICTILTLIVKWKVCWFILNKFTGNAGIPTALHVAATVPKPTVRKRLPRINPLVLDHILRVQPGTPQRRIRIPIREPIYFDANRYNVYESLGKGGSGQVWLVQLDTYDASDTKPRHYLSSQPVLAIKEVNFESANANTSANNNEDKDEEVNTELNDPEPNSHNEFQMNCKIFFENYQKKLQAKLMREVFVREVEMLERLKTPKTIDFVVQMINYEVCDLGGKILLDAGQHDLVRSFNNPMMTHDRFNSIILDMATAVGAIHSLGIVHFDIKPSNFVWFGTKLKLIDFGIASTLEFIQENATSPTPVRFLGTPGFMSPEVLMGDHVSVGLKSDVWSFGAILYGLFKGKRMMTGVEDIREPEMKLDAIRLALDEALNEDFNTSTPGFYSVVLKGCLEMEPGKRWDSAKLINSIRIGRLPKMFKLDFQAESIDIITII